jgi:hypothetical protein
LSTAAIYRTACTTARLWNNKKKSTIQIALLTSQREARVECSSCSRLTRAALKGIVNKARGIKSQRVKRINGSISSHVARETRPAMPAGDVVLTRGYAGYVRRKKGKKPIKSGEILPSISAREAKVQTKG